MKKLFKITALAVAVALSMGITASAFSDMPDGEMGTAMQNAVDAHLIEGIDDNTIAPYANITRAQMATILVRAFSASAMSDTTFPDVASDAWYAQSVSKAVAMGAFEGDDDGNFNPENNITFQETYTVLSRMFGFEPYNVTYSSEDSIKSAYEYLNKNFGFTPYVAATTAPLTVLLGDCPDSVLDQFSDKGEIAGWAYNYAKYIVGNGGWQGIDGKLKPTDYVTRGEFALIMDSIVETYIDEPGEYKSLSDGLTMVRSGGVTIDGLNTDSNLIFTYGVDEKGCNVTNSNVNGVTLVLGGADPTPEADSNGKLQPNESYISIEGKYYDLRIMAPYILFNASGATIGFAKGVSNSIISLGFLGG